MPKVTIVQVVYNNRQFIEPVFSAIFAQTFKDFNVVAVISGNEDGGKELLMEKFPQVEIIDPGYNIGFAAGHNLVFSAGGGPAYGGESDFFQLVNPDLIMESNYIEEMLKAFEDPKVGAATGKLYMVPTDALTSTRVPLVYEGNPRLLDTTGINISKSGRARDRGQHQLDSGQYDKDLNLKAISAAGAMYRRSTLQAISYQLSAKNEFFDEDFHSYWEDVDLTWRMTNAGWKCRFAPAAIAYHGRGAGSSEGGYKNIVGFIKHHKKLSPRIRQLNYKNHIFMYIKNSEKFYLEFFIREFFMLLYIIIFEPSTLKIFPNFLKEIPKMWRKRKLIEAL